MVFNLHKPPTIERDMLNTYRHLATMSLLICFLLGGCSTPPPTVDEAKGASMGELTDEELAERIVGVAYGFASAITQNHPDCTKVADGMQSVLEENSDLYELRERLVEQDPQRMERLRAQIEPTTEKFIKPHLVLLNDCAQEPRIQAILDKMPR